MAWTNVVHAYRRAGVLTGFSDIDVNRSTSVWRVIYFGPPASSYHAGAGSGAQADNYYNAKGEAQT